MSSDYTERYIFEAEWYDKVACMLKKFYLYYYPFDDTVELFDIKSRKTFLRRMKCEGIQAKDLYVDAMVTIFSRCMKITGYADDNTKNKLKTKTQKTFALLKPDTIGKMGLILKHIMSDHFHISNLKMIKLSKEDAMEFCKKDESAALPYIIDYLVSGPVLALELLRENGISHWQEVMGPTDSDEARRTAPQSLRALYGNDNIHNALHGSENKEAAERELDFFFPGSKSKKKGPKNTATFRNCTCCIIKPHAVQAQLIGDIVEDVQKAGYDVTAIQQFYVNSVNAEEFLEVYKGVLPDYGAMVAELQSGPCVVMEITHKNEGFDINGEFRKLCGPMDPDMARQVRPNTLRAKYGKTKVQNAIHCSDLPEDGPLEVEYFFKILDAA